MRRFLLTLSVLTLVFISCTKKSDALQDADSFIGSWSLHRSFLNGVELNLSECAKQSTIEIYENGTMTSFTYDDFTGTCQMDDVDNSTWENKGNNIYEIISNGVVSTISVAFQGDTLSSTEQVGNDTYMDVLIRN